MEFNLQTQLSPNTLSGIIRTFFSKKKKKKKKATGNLQLFLEQFLLK